jgi:hypothetical protein
MKKEFKIISILLAVVVVLLCIPMVGSWLISTGLASSWKSKLKSQLSSLNSFDEMDQVVSPLGVVLGSEDSNWVAIGYKDNHTMVVASCAVARLKDGRMFASDVHFCGSLMMYPSQKEDWESYVRDDPRFDGMNFVEYLESQEWSEWANLRRIETAVSVDDQIQLLNELGFTLMDE